MSKINIKYMTDEAIETLRANKEQVTEMLVKNPKSAEWLYSFVPRKIFVEKKYTIEDFTLKIPKNSNDKSTDLENSVMLYEHLSPLPKYVLTDERFWEWILFEKGYQVALKYMPVKKGDSVFKDHWLFTGGQRRGMFFGVLSRCYLRVDFTRDSSQEDPYELTRFVIENPERFRNLTWRTFSSNKKIVRACLRAERDVMSRYGGYEDNSIYPELAKYISKLGSVRLIDVMDEEDIYKMISAEFERMICDSLDKAKQKKTKKGILSLFSKGE